MDVIELNAQTRAWLVILQWCRKFHVKLLPEQEEQIKLFCWIRSKPYLKDIVFHIPNERKTSRISGHILKLMGVMPGVSDVFVPIASGGYHGLFLELKAGKNKPTPAQIAFLNAMLKQGYAAMYVTGHEAAIAFIETYLEPVIEILE